MVWPFTASYSVCVSHAVGTSAGCLLLVRASLGADVQKVTTSESGRLIVCDLAFSSHKWRVICIYAHNTAEERKTFFEDIRSFFETERIVIFVRDFNCVLSARDETSTLPFRDASTVVLNEIVNHCGLEDVGDCLWDTRNVPYTHFQGSSHARLDRAYISLEILPQCSEYRVMPVSFSDHCLVLFTVASAKEKRKDFCWELWKLNSKLTSDDDFMAAVKDSLGGIFKGQLRFIFDI
uniref:Putative tick transposon n=1 Tax=Ixodes ricinus TaxID=34613 RepID=A0A6B0V524_IXORI